VSRKAAPVTAEPPEVPAAPDASWRDPDIETLRLSRKVTSRLRGAKIEHIGALVDALDNGETFSLDAREITAVWHAIKTNSACPADILIDGEADDEAEASVRTCRMCGCTEADCSQCIAATGKPCSWVEGDPDLCTACVAAPAPEPLLIDRVDLEDDGTEAVADADDEASDSKTETAFGPSILDLPLEPLDRNGPEIPGDYLKNWPEAPDGPDRAAVYDPAVPLAKILPSPTNPRKTFDLVKLNELAKSIAEKGVLEPILLRPLGDHFEIIAGERRYRAAKLAGVASIPATIRDYSDRDVVEIQIIENDQREDVHELEQAEGYATLIRMGVADAETLAERIGRTPKYVYARLALNGLTPEWKADLTAGKITFAVATLLARLPHSRQEQVRPTPDKWGNHHSPIFDYNGNCRSITTVKRDLQNALINLSSARWKLDDAELLPSAGSCKACPKRTGSKPDLFAELVDGAKEDEDDDEREYYDDEDDDPKPKSKAKAKKPAAAPDFCTDSVCFAAKGTALVQLNVRKLAEKTKTDADAIPVVSERYTTADGSGMLGASGYTELTPKEVKAFGKAIPADVVPAVLGDGDEVGKTVYVRIRKEPSAARGSLAGGDSNIAFAKQQREAREKNELDKAMQKQVVAAVVEKFEAGGQKALDKCWDKLATLFEFEMGADARYRLGGAFGVGKEDLVETIRERGDKKPFSVLGMFVAAVVGSMPPRSDYVSPDVKAFLKSLDIDHTAILKQLAAERKAEKAAKQKPAKAKGGKAK
jgi:ParB/RepB/Spo0J family partition protein